MRERPHPLSAPESKPCHIEAGSVEVERIAARHAVADVFRKYKEKFKFLAQAAGFVAVMEGCAHAGPVDVLEPNQRDIILPVKKPKEKSLGEDLRDIAIGIQKIRTLGQGDPKPVSKDIHQDRKTKSEPEGEEAGN